MLECLICKLFGHRDSRLMDIGVMIEFWECRYCKEKWKERPGIYQ